MRDFPLQPGRQVRMHPSWRRASFPVAVLQGYFNSLCECACTAAWSSSQLYWCPSIRREGSGRKHLSEIGFCCIKTSTEEDHVWANEPSSILLPLGGIFKGHWVPGKKGSFWPWELSLFWLEKLGMRVYMKTLKILQHLPFCVLCRDGVEESTQCILWELW